jgi:hypothetical protein
MRGKGTLEAKQKVRMGARQRQNARPLPNPPPREKHVQGRELISGTRFTKYLILNNFYAKAPP